MGGALPLPLAGGAPSQLAVMDIPCQTPKPPKVADPAARALAADGGVRGPPSSHTFVERQHPFSPEDLAGAIQ